MPEAPGCWVWENTVRESRRDDLGLQSFLPLTHTHKHTCTCDLSHSAIHPHAHTCSHPQVLGRLPQRPQTRLTNHLFHPLPQQYTLVAMPTQLAVLVIFGSVASEEAQWCCDITAVSWQLWDRAAEQGRPLNHGICLNVSSERPPLPSPLTPWWL